MTDAIDATQAPLVQLDFQAATDLVNNAQHILLVTHLSPDGDAIGSMCGLGLALQHMGKTVTMAVDEGVNEYLSYVVGSEAVLPTLDNPTADLVISCDAGDIERIGEVGKIAFSLDVPKIVVDHHITNTLFGDANIVHSEYVSTTEAVMHWLDFMKVDIPDDVANALMVGYMTDTVSFRVGPVTADTLRQAARLIDQGADMRGAIVNMLMRFDPNQLLLRGRGFVRYHVEDRVGWTYLTQEDFKEADLTLTEKPRLSSELLSDPRVYITCLFSETETGDVKLSMRAVEGFDVGAIAESLDGGGHILAAGATIEQASLTEAMDKVIPLLKAEAERGTPKYG